MPSSTAKQAAIMHTPWSVSMVCVCVSVCVCVCVCILRPQESTGVDNARMFEELYQYYARPEAWKLAPGTRPRTHCGTQAGTPPRTQPSTQPSTQPDTQPDTHRV